MTRIAFYGSSLVSSYWNGAATYYRGLIKALSELGYRTTFYEPDAYDRQSHRDIEPPEWCEVVVYPATSQGVQEVTDEVGKADIVVKASGVGFADDIIFERILGKVRDDALVIFWDVDAPATLAQLRSEPGHPLHRHLQSCDLVLTYGGGDPVVNAYRELGVDRCIPIYNALDPDTHFPVDPDPRFEAHLGFLGNRLPDREERVEEFFLKAAADCPELSFLLGGSGWADKSMPQNVRALGHVGTADHNAFNRTPRAVLNISRESMARNGFSPATRVFEAAGAGACLITDYWEGIDMFLTPGSEVFVARDGKDVAEIVSSLDAQTATSVGEAALARVLREHTYDRRAKQVDAIFSAMLADRPREAAQ